MSTDLVAGVLGDLADDRVNPRAIGQVVEHLQGQVDALARHAARLETELTALTRRVENVAVDGSATLARVTTVESRLSTVEAGHTSSKAAPAAGKRRS